MVLAPTLIWMLIAGCCWLGCSERGAFGFSNERSLMYCARTLSCAGACCWPAWAPAAPPACQPLVGMLMRCSSAAQARSPAPPGWLTQGVRPDKDRVGLPLPGPSIRLGLWLQAAAGGRRPEFRQDPAARAAPLPHCPCSILGQPG